MNEDQDYLSPQHQQTSSSPSFGANLVGFFETLIVSLAIASFIYAFVAQPHKVFGSSMYPNFHHGDYILSNKIEYYFSLPKRGQVIVFKNPRNTSQDFIKRIIGLPGEKVKIASGHIYINDQILNESYLDPSVFTNTGVFIREGEQVEVPTNHYLVLGDNRAASSDSREWGFVSKDQIIGQAILRYFPLNEVGLIQGANY